MHEDDDEPTALIAAVRARIEKTEVGTQPFPHIWVRDIFPPPYYQELLARWPTHEEFVDLMPGEGIVFGMFFRAMRSFLAPQGVRRRVTQGLCVPGLVKEHRFWWRFRSVVEQAVIPTVVSKFAPHIRPLLREECRSTTPDLTPENFEIIDDMLIVRRNKHILTAHIDDLRSLIQLLIYLPEDSSRPHLGTRLFEQVGSGSAKAPAEMEHPRRAQYADRLGIEVKEVKRIPFLTNTLVANLNHPRSWHGQHLDEPYDRKGYQAFIGVKSDLLGRFFEPASAAVLAAES